MKIEKVLANIRSSQAPEKTAAEQTPTTKTASSVPAEALKGALTEALKTSEKVAAEQKQPGPVEDVMKIAAEMANAEQDIAVKQAALLGAAFYDGAMARAAQYQKAAAELNTDTDPEFSKFASENPELVKQAAELGYQQTRDGLEKMADDAYTQGWNNTVEAIYKTAAVEFMKAAQVTGAMLEQYAAK